MVWSLRERRGKRSGIMKKFPSQIEAHYFRSQLFEEILERLKASGIAPGQIGRKDISAVDEFHVRGAQVSKELAELAEIRNSRVLDIGCGIGGPARMLADEYGCEVTGIDLSEEFVRTATRLSELVGLGGKTHFVQGDATSLPFSDQSFDVVWTQHVQMNIEDKMKFYAEIRRVLASDGVFLYYDIFKNGDGEINYPVPWANNPEISFLFDTQEFESIIETLGFSKMASQDQTDSGIIFFENLLGKIRESGPPNIGLNLLMGDSTKTKLTHLLQGLKEGKLVLQSGVCRPVNAI